jgi:hypothetical protein
VHSAVDAPWLHPQRRDRLCTGANGLSRTRRRARLTRHHWATIGVPTIIVVADLTAGRFNLVVGLVGALSGVAASISTGVSGFVFQTVGSRLAHLSLAPIAAAATALLWVFLSETKPHTYED